MTEDNVPLGEGSGEAALLPAWFRPGCSSVRLSACRSVGRVPPLASAYPNTTGNPHNDRLASSTPISVAASTSLG